MIFRSPYPDVTIPEIALTPFVLQHAGRLSDKPALIDGASGRTLTYGQLADAIRRVAGSLAARGFRKGDVMGIFSPNLPEYAIAFHAVASLGGINTTANPLYTVDELAQQLRDAGTRYLLTVPALLEKALSAAEKAKVEEVFVFGDGEGATSFARLLEDQAPAPAVPIDAAEDVVALPYSSGTTGLPKGVMLTHRNLVANLVQIDAIGHVTEHDTLLCVLPMFHIYGMVVIMNHGLAKGATIVTMPRFELETVLRAMERYQVSFAHLVPPVVLAFAKQPAVEKFDLSKLRAIFSGAAPLGEELSRQCQERLGCQVRQGYGMTEASPVTHMSPKAAQSVRLGSVGHTVPNTECRLVDPATGADVGERQQGELLVRGPQVMKGYLNRPEATALTVDREGWLHTGDIGYADEDGQFYIVDRVKELIKYKGLQVAPAELEAVLLSHPAVADVAVIPIPDDEAGEVPKAFVVLRQPVPTDQLLSFVAERVAPHKKVRRIEVVEQIPKSPSGKILRRVLVETERERRRSEAQA